MAHANGVSCRETPFVCTAYARAAIFNLFNTVNFSNAVGSLPYGLPSRVGVYQPTNGEANRQVTPPVGQIQPLPRHNFHPMFQLSCPVVAKR